MRRLNTNVSMAGLALIASDIEPDPEIALIPLRGESDAKNVVAPESGPMPGPMSTNLHTRAGEARAAEVAVGPGIDLDTIKGMLRNEGAAWNKADALLKKAYGT